MKFDDRGRKDAPALVLMGWPFSTPASLLPVVEKLPDHRVILPTWDGEDGSEVDFTTRQDQAAQILAYLKAQDVRRVSLVGISLGASVAIELAWLIIVDGSIRLGGILCDGGTFLRRTWIKRFLRSLFVSRLFKKAKQGTEEEAVAMLMRSRAVRLFTGPDPAPFRPLLTDMTHVARVVSARSVRAFEKAMCSFSWTPLPDELTRRTVFLWSGKDPARRAQRKLRSVYPNAIYQSIGRYGHGGLALAEPASYALLIKGITAEY